MMFPAAVTQCLTTLHSAGFNALLVGGCVRDLLRGCDPQDWDITTSASPVDVLACFPDAKPAGFGTVTVANPSVTIEITPHRTETYTATDRRRPAEVTFGAPLELDLARRDFTVNAMAMSIDGIVTDPWGGQADLENHVLRTVGDPKTRFNEDTLRILRGLRFASVLALRADSATDAALRACAPLLQTLSAERVRRETTKLLLGGGVLDVLLSYKDVLAVLFPEITPMFGFLQHNRHHCYDVWEHTARAVAALPPVSNQSTQTDDLARALVRWAALLHDIGKPSVFFLDPAGVGHFHGHAEAGAQIAEAVLRRLQFPNRTRERIVRLVREHTFSSQPTERKVRLALLDWDKPDLCDLLDLRLADHSAKNQTPGRMDNIVQFRAILDSLDGWVTAQNLDIRYDDFRSLGFHGDEGYLVKQQLLRAAAGGDVPNRRADLLAWLRELCT